MSSWTVKIRGQKHSVRMKSPTFGRKSIFVDGEEVRKVGSAVTMWSNYDFQIHGKPATIRFRAIKSMKGMSLVINGKVIPPDPENAEFSAEAIGYLMIGVLVLFVCAAIFGILNGGR